MAPPTVDAVKRIAIVGTGTIGSGWAAVFLSRDCEVCAYVRSAASEAKFIGFLQVAWRKLVARGLAADADGWRAVKCVRDLSECVSTADYVQESVVEDLSLKQGIIAQIDQHTPSETLIATSSSYIPLSLVGTRSACHPERIATVHPTLPQWDNFVEVLGSCDEHTQWLAAFMSRMGMDTITLNKEMWGHVHNFMLAVSLSSGIGLVKSGVTSAAEVDRALVHMSRLIIASGGISHALVDVVGNGDRDAFLDLSTDIVLGAPAGLGACLSTWCLPSWLASICLWLITAWARVCSASTTLKKIVRHMAGWANREFLVQRSRELVRLAEADGSPGPSSEVDTLPPMRQRTSPSRQRMPPTRQQVPALLQLRSELAEGGALSPSGQQLMQTATRQFEQQALKVRLVVSEPRRADRTTGPASRLGLTCSRAMHVPLVRSLGAAHVVALGARVTYVSPTQLNGAAAASESGGSAR